MNNTISKNKEMNKITINKCIMLIIIKDSYAYELDLNNIL